jgi:hypothetical protein
MVMKIKGHMPQSLCHSDWLLRLYDEYKLIQTYLLSRKRLTASSLPSGSAPFFIVGSGRSGNTLLRALLANHPEISIPPESYVLGAVIRKYRSLSFLPWSELSRLIILKFEEHPQFYTWDMCLQSVYETIIKFDVEKQTLANLLDTIYMCYAKKNKPSATRWGDKTPMNTFHLQSINKVFPEAKFIHIIRDGRDVVSSYLRAGIYTDTKEACGRWLTSIRLAQKLGRRLGKKQYLEIHYEDLVKHPEDSSKTVCGFINLEYQAEILHFYKTVKTLGDTHLEHHGNVHTPINTNSIGKWRENLSSEQKSLVGTMLKKDLLRLGYK